MHSLSRYLHTYNCSYFGSILVLILMKDWTSLATCLTFSAIGRIAAAALPWTWASVNGRAEPPVMVIPAADPASFLDLHGASHGLHLANVEAIAREVLFPCCALHFSLRPSRHYGGLSETAVMRQRKQFTAARRYKYLKGDGNSARTSLHLCKDKFFWFRYSPHVTVALAQDFQDFEALDSGEWQALPGGVRWHLALRSPGATSLALLFRCAPGPGKALPAERKKEGPLCASRPRLSAWHPDAM